jgi:ribosome-associated toxin RatA of RatAB toxin-antitoxin module
MQSGKSTRVIAASVDQIWTVLRDVTTIDMWHPSVASVDLLSENPVGLSARRRCNFRDGTNVIEEVIELEEARRVRFRLSEFSLPMQRLEAEFCVEPDGNGATTTSFEICFVPKFGVLGKMLGAVVIRRKLSGVAAEVLAGLDNYVVKGQTAGPAMKAAA